MKQMLKILVLIFVCTFSWFIRYYTSMKWRHGQQLFMCKKKGFMKTLLVTHGDSCLHKVRNIETVTQAISTRNLHVLVSELAHCSMLAWIFFFFFLLLNWGLSYREDIDRYRQFYLTKQKRESNLPAEIVTGNIVKNIYTVKSLY